MLVDFNYTYQSKNVLSGGLRIKHIETNLEITNFLGTSSLENREGASISAFLKYNLLQFQNFGLELGSRLHGTRLAGGGVAINYEPRISLSYWLLPQLAIKSSYGHFIQDLVTVSDENEVITVFEPWIITPLYLKPSNAIHYNIGLEILANQNLSIELEGYYKDLKNLAVLNENKITVDAHDFIQASGESYGAELTCQYNLHPFLFTCAYSLMKSQRTADGKTYSPRYDSRNNISLSSEVDLGYGWNASVLWKYNSGTPFTQITGYYEKLTPELIGDRAFILDSYSYFTKLGEKNLGRLPDYHRLDFNIKKKFIFTSFSATIDFSIQNVYNRANIFYFKRDTGERVNMIPFLPSISVKVEL